MHTAPAGPAPAPSTEVSFRNSILRLPESLPLKVEALELPVPLDPSPVLSVWLPNPICQNTTWMFVGVFGWFGSANWRTKFGSGTGLKYASSAHWKMANPPRGSMHTAWTRVTELARARSDRTNALRRRRMAGFLHKGAGWNSNCRKIPPNRCCDTICFWIGWFNPMPVLHYSLYP